MIDYAKARAAMVEGQVRTNDVTDTRLHEAMMTVPRELFVPKARRSLAYMAEPVEIGEDRYLPDPRTFSKLVQALDVRPGDMVLEIGCGTGYGTAVLAHLADTVVGVESDEALAAAADQTLADLSIDNAATVVAPFTEGAPAHGPFDVILVGGGTEIVCETWLDQLAPGGRLGVVEIDGHLGRAWLYVRAGGSVSSRVVFDAAIPVLPGLTRKPAFVF